MAEYVEIIGGRELAELWERAPEAGRRALMAGIEEASMLLQREAQELTPVGASGLLRQSILAQRPSIVGEGVIGMVKTAIAHGVPVELGTRPHFPPLQPLIDWVKARLDIQKPSEQRSVAFLIGRKIARKGTQPVLMFGRAFEANKDQVKAIMDGHIARFVEAAL